MGYAIKTAGLGKRYRIHHEGGRVHDTLRDAMAASFRSLVGRRSHGERPSEETFWALRDLDLEITTGQKVGIVGRNGAGKSTLLKLLSRISEPSAGQVRIRGRVACLLEVGTGFHSELSGRENIFLSGAIHGMTRRDVARRFDQIVAFAEVERFLDTPVKRYSSGMYTRLAFSVAAHLDSDILILDEVLAVGDRSFQRRCLESIDASASAGRTVLFVSHNLGLVQSLCDRAVLLEQGRLVADGAVDSVLAAYFDNEGGSASGSENLEQSARHMPFLGRRVRLLQISLVDESGQAVTRLQCGSPFAVELLARASSDEEGVAFVVRIDGFDGTPLALAASQHAGWSVDMVQGGTYKIRVDLDSVLLLPGSYRLTVSVRSGQQGLDQVCQAFAFEVVELHHPRVAVAPGQQGQLALFGSWGVQSCAE